jgi:hypothetical protein
MDRFSRARFEGLSPERRWELCTELAQHLSRQLRGRAFHKAVYALVAELKFVGHDLWSQDEDDEFQVWGPNYENPRSGGGLVITFTVPDEVTVEPVSE